MSNLYDVLSASFAAAAADEASLLPPAVAEIAFAGRSNVGKSSLLNALMQRKGLVRTSGTPGCTRTINFFRAATRGGLDLTLVDLPGYGFAKRSKHERVEWGSFVTGYLLRRPTLRAVVIIVDIRRGIEDDDLQLMELCAAKRPRCPTLRTILVATKLDLLPKAKRKPTLAALRATSSVPIIGFSSESSEGYEALWYAVDKVITGDSSPASRGENP